MIHAFEDCELDDELYQLRRRGRLVRLEPKVFDVLMYLLRQRHRVVAKDELLDAVWPGLAVSESVLPKCVAAARRSVGDGRARARIIATVHGRGYRFVAPVTARPAAVTDSASIVGDASVPAFIGRADVLARLRSASASARAGRGRLVLLGGEPGIGKSRTAEELARDARREGGRVLTGRAHDGEGAPPFWAWVQVLRGCADDADLRRRVATSGATTPELAALVPELCARRPAAARSLATDGEQARFRLFDEIIRLLAGAAAHQPIVVLLDDVHWADEASLRLLGLLAAEIAETRLLVIATYRDDQYPPDHAMARLLGVLARERACEWITLGGLQPAETAEVVRTIAGDGVTASALTAVHEITGGNAFFVHEIAQLLRGAGAPATPGTDRHSDTTFVEARALASMLPQRVRDAIRRRLAALRAEAAQLLRVAAVLGREFDVAVLARVAGVPRERVLALLAEARAARVVDAVGEGGLRYAFHHVLIRQTLADDLAAAERVDLHRRAAESIEATYGADSDACLEELALHLFAAAAGGDAARAVGACTRAGERAYGLLAYEQSGRHYERALQALELLADVDETRRARLLLALGDAHAASGGLEASRSAFGRAAASARRIGRSDLLALAALGYRGPHEMGSPVEAPAAELVDEALATLGDANPPLRGRLLSRLVGMPPHSNSMETRERLSIEALALVGRDPVARREALMARLWACLGPDRIDERLTVARELLALAEREGSKQIALLAYDAELGARLLRGEMEAADRALAGYRRLAEDLRQPTLLFLAEFWEGSRTLARGELETAERLFRAALARGRGTMPYAHFMFTGQMYPLIYLRGQDDDPELSGIFFGEMMDLPYSWATAMRTALAFALVLRGDVVAARREFDAIAEAGFETIRRDEHWLVTLGGVSNLAVLLGDDARAALLFDLLLPYADLVIVHDLLRSVSGTVAATLGHLATILHRLDEGAAYYERARATEQRNGMALALVETETGYARLLRQRNRRGDRSRADALIDGVRRRMAAIGIRRNWLLDLVGGTAPSHVQDPKTSR